MAYAIILDGVTYPSLNIFNLSRTSEIIEDNTGATLISGTRRRGIIGTYVNYSMAIERNQENLIEYDDFYTAITAPIESHSLIAPYGQTEITIDVMIDSVTDNLILQDVNGNKWSGMVVNFKSQSPLIGV